MNGLTLLAIDPALRNVGLARLFVAGNGDVSILDLRLVKTESEAGKTVRKNSDDLRRATAAFEAILHMAAGVDLIAAEIPSGTQSARGAMSNGISLGLLAALGVIQPPLIEVSAAEAKRVATGRKNATKDEMIAWAANKYPHAPWLRKKLKGSVSLIDANEHLADAVAIGHAALKTPAVQTALKIKSSLVPA